MNTIPQKADAEKYEFTGEDVIGAVNEQDIHAVLLARGYKDSPRHNNRMVRPGGDTDTVKLLDGNKAQFFNPADAMFSDKSRSTFDVLLILKYHSDKKAAIKAESKRLGMDGKKQATKPKIAAIYDYRDEFNAPLFQVVRFEPKDFRQRRPEGQGQWTWKLDGIRRVLYRLPELLNSSETRPDDFVLIVEGEKDADNCWARGLIATCNPGGAGKWREEYNPPLFLRKIRIIPDRDESGTGMNHAQQVAKSLIEYHHRAGQVADVAIIELATEGAAHAA